jgi:hypothetical protein
MLSLLTSALSDLKSMNLRQLLLQLVSLGLIVTSALGDLEVADAGHREAIRLWWLC